MRKDVGKEEVKRWAERRIKRWVSVRQEVVTMEGKEVDNEEDKEMVICKAKRWSPWRVKR